MGGSSVEVRVRMLVLLVFVLGALLGLEAGRVASWLPLLHLLSSEKPAAPPVAVGESPAQVQEEKEYARQSLALDQTEVVELGNGDFPGTRVVKVTGRVKNTGTKTVRSMRACVWFKDESGKDIWEHEAPIFVVSDDWAPLRPGYLWHFVMVSKATPLEWQKGKQEVDITGVTLQR